MKLSTIIGSKGISFEYVINTVGRNITNARTVMVEASDMGQFPKINDSDYTVDHAAHFEIYFKNDSKEVLLIVKKLLLNTPAYNHILEAVKSKNGRTAYNSLIIYYEGEEFIQCNIQLVFDTLNTTFYKGEKY